METLGKISPALSICSLALSTGTAFYAYQLREMIVAQNSVISALCAQVKELSSGSEKTEKIAQEMQTINRQLKALNERLDDMEDELVTEDQEQKDRLQNLISQLSSTGIEISQPIQRKVTKTRKKNKPRRDRRAKNHSTDESGDEQEDDVDEINRMLRERRKNRRN